MSLTDHLHDEVDEIERLREKAKAIVADMVKDGLAKSFESADDAQDALAAVAEEIEEAMIDVTTEAFQSVAKLAMKRPTDGG